MQAYTLVTEEDMINGIYSNINSCQALPLHGPLKYYQGAYGETALYAAASSGNYSAVFWFFGLPEITHGQYGLSDQRTGAFSRLEPATAFQLEPRNREQERRVASPLDPVYMENTEPQEADKRLRQTKRQRKIGTPDQ
ncbi:hypothetical protein TSTA_108830 [Talaromyces stipitatus ATCC 10500]|uniref:Uncharacterized protein n=1 Tax=Talaromyces stipitatus (strain ATCC 10500 / CBS 375.48 / QM 6759 / NRRL 1006) TaxID=441959 RepID=B8MUN3_TALSN|nr:uncharacterized protein TSTA_108830 [Talaromyces stipitatus ATCC 10500]EED11701.1 hypothetical protein TSTA_108830 [Talaromyces stipitatus ATCC 10500]